jgi:hypothetical protein
LITPITDGAGKRAAIGARVDTSEYCLLWTAVGATSV